MNSTSVSSSSSDAIFIDFEGRHYLVKDTFAAGDCALLSLLSNPRFAAPVSSSTELRRAIVSFARGESRQECFNTYALIGERANMHFEFYLDHVLRPGFWVGTIFYIWTSLAYGCDIRSHFFNEFRETKVESTAEFIKRYFPQLNLNFDVTIDVFFHQYMNRARCKPSMYNHYAALIPIESVTDSSGLSILNDLVNIEKVPWWKKTEEANGYDFSGKQPKPKKQKKEMNREDRKKYNTALTYHYLREQDNGEELAADLEKKLEKALDKETDLACAPGVSVTNVTDIFNEKMPSTRALSAKYVGRTWKQRAVIIFIFLHPRMGQRNLGVTCALTGVKERTLSGWLTQKKMIKMWVDIVEDMTADTALRSLPASVQDVYINVDPESTVSAHKYRRRLPDLGSNLHVYYKGGKVSVMFCVLFQKPLHKILMKNSSTVQHLFLLSG
jgi:hypothetical protein